MNKPTSILDPKFKYVSSSNTDLKKTFARIRKEQKDASKVQTVPEIRQFNPVLFKKYR